MKFAATSIALASALCCVNAASYSRTDHIAGNDFYNAFEFQAIGDPTQGRVNYVDKATAQRKNLTYASSDTFILRADHTTTLSPGGPGRDSVRIRSLKKFTKHVAVFDIRHMPQGCGTWPAVWETDEAIWPAGGEIDILEGVNDQSPNSATIHTTQGCTMPASRQQTGFNKQLDCDHNVNGNAGCGVGLNEPNNYGPPFNANGGGIYALERTPTYMRVWFWPRGAANTPADVLSGAASINTSNWGTPSADFPNTSCDFTQKFDAHNIIINLTLCGDWAGPAFPGVCPGNCIDYVNSNPSAFNNAFFDFKSINLYA